MLLLVSGGFKRLARYRSPYLGRLIVPSRLNGIAEMIEAGVPWAVDNECYTRWNETAFRTMLTSLQGQPNCLFVVAPDVVADAQQTLQRFKLWGPIIRKHGLPVALVAQDGMTVADAPWDRLDALFIGGSTQWKLGRQAARLMKETKAQGKLLHMGRVNTLRRVRYANDFGCDSVDGSGWVMFEINRSPNLQEILAYLAWLGETRQRQSRLVI